jgi:hypothetical protein
MKNYGFTTEKYNDGSEIETLQTGDGKAEFVTIGYDDDESQVGIGFGYGQGTGIGEKVKYAPKTTTSDVGIKWQVKFDCEASIDILIDQLSELKQTLKAKA